MSRVRCAFVVMLLAAVAAESCGSGTDLIIGRDAVLVTPGGGGSGSETDSGGASGNDTGGMVDGSGADAGGSVANGGRAPTSGSGGAAGADVGVAGNGASGAAGEPACSAADVAPPGSLLHRYSFDGTGLVAADSVGAADGQIAEAQPGAPAPPCPAEPHPMLDGKGQAVLDGCKGYVNLPNHLISVLTDVTIVTWQTWLGGAAFERYFDFGVGAGEDDTTSKGASYLAVATSGTNMSKLQLLVRQASTNPEQNIRTVADMNDKREHQVALVFVGQSYAALYRDGVELGRLAISWPLSAINDVNDWIGRSQWASDHTFKGSVNEFRIYGKALTPCAIQALYAAGPTSP